MNEAVGADAGVEQHTTRSTPGGERHKRREAMLAAELLDDLASLERARCLAGTEGDVSGKRFAGPSSGMKTSVRLSTRIVISTPSTGSSAIGVKGSTERARATQNILPAAESTPPGARSTMPELASRRMAVRCAGGASRVRQ